MPSLKAKAYITDFGINLQIRGEDGITSELERYGVWVLSGRGKYEVAEVSDDVQALMTKYDVPAERVIPFTVGEARAEGAQAEGTPKA